jgi:hypothetical protein
MSSYQQDLQSRGISIPKQITSREYKPLSSLTDHLPSAPPLPENWKAIFDPNTQVYYYFNSETNETTWVLPEEILEKGKKRKADELEEKKNLKQDKIDQDTNTVDTNIPVVPVIEIDEDTGLGKWESVETIEIKHPIKPNSLNAHKTARDALKPKVLGKYASQHEESDDDEDIMIHTNENESVTPVSLRSTFGNSTIVKYEAEAESSISNSLDSTDTSTPIISFKKRKTNSTNIKKPSTLS